LRARSKRAISLCACCALDSAARRRSTAALGGNHDREWFRQPDDLVGFVRSVASNLSELDFGESADELVAWSNSAWTTGSEFLGELGLRCRQVVERDGDRLPARLREDIECCLNECRKAFQHPSF
jgi:hypothetical protein